MRLRRLARVWRRGSQVRQSAQTLGLCLLLLVVASCGGRQATETTLAAVAGADTALGAVEVLVDAIKSPDFAQAGRLVVPGHAALAALAEGATFGEVARALEEGDSEIAANFWAGFAQGTGAFLFGTVSADEGGTLTEGGLEFHTVSVTPDEEGTRTILVREQDGYRIDLFASFGAGLADKMIAPVERLLQTQTADARIILVELQGIVPSLLVAASLPGTTGGASQNLLALVEMITRVG